MTLTVMMPLAVGIDLGTTNSCIAVYRKKVPEVIVNDEGHRLTESRVFFSDKSETEILVGELAKENECPPNEIFDVKRFIGRKFGDVEDEVKELYPFKIAKGEDDNVEIEIKRGDGYIYKKPEEISAIILKKLIKAASDTLEDEFNSEAVITVPAYFNNEQRAATKRAAEIAGLKVLRLLNEPTAAAIDYYFKLNNTKGIKKNLVVYDLGGGTFDISIIEITDKRITVKYVGGDTHLGGKNFDDRLYEKYRNEIWSKHGIRIDKKAAKVKRVREHCEKVKKQLSHRKEAKVILSYLDHKTETINFDLKREEFEKMNIDLFNKTIKILKDCLYEAKLKPEDIDNVLLVGGSSMIPKIQELLADLFGSNKLQKKCNFEEAVATGAAIQASLLIEDPKKAIEDIILTDVLSESLGTDIEGYKMSVIIKNNTPLPAENTKRYKTIRDNQQFMLIKVLQGNNEDARKNLCLKEMRIEGLTLAPKGEVKIHVKFSVDVNGILQVTATEKLTGKTKKLEIILNKRNM